MFRFTQVVDGIMGLAAVGRTLPPPGMHGDAHKRTRFGYISLSFRALAVRFRALPFASIRVFVAD